MIITPVMLVKNEEVWIRRVISALASTFPNIIVCDTGSTDSTVSEIEELKKTLLFQLPHLLNEYEVYSRKYLGQMTDRKTSPQFLSWCRQYMQAEAMKRFDATHIFLVDGDELYTKRYLRFIDENPMPEDALSGFTSGIEVGELENGELWFYNAGLNRQSIIPVGSCWKGVYPFESPDCYIPGSPRNHYFRIPDRCHGFYHLHHTRRSRNDADVYLREQKRNQFSMQDAPSIIPEKFWLKSQKDYVDE